MEIGTSPTSPDPTKLPLLGGTLTGALAIALAAATSGAPAASLALNAPAHTGVTASTEVHDVDLNIQRSQQWAAGALATQRFVRVRQPTIAFVSASTVARAATVAIAGAPVAGANATLTNSWSLWVQGGVSRFDSRLEVQGVTEAVRIARPLDDSTGAQLRFLKSRGTEDSPTTVSANDELGNITAIGHDGTSFSATNSGAFGFIAEEGFTTGAHGTKFALALTRSGTTTRADVFRVSGGGNITTLQAAHTSGTPVAFTFGAGAHTNLTASTEANDVVFSLSRTVQFAAGAITTQRAVLVGQPTYAFVSSSTISDVASFAIVGNPLPGTNASFTRAYALWVQSGRSRFQGSIIEDGSISPTALTGSTNDYNPTSFSSTRTVRQDVSSPASLTGLLALQGGYCVTLINISTNVANTLTLRHESSSSTAANRFNLPGQVDAIIPAGGSVDLWYDSPSSRWRMRARSVDNQQISYDEIVFSSEGDSAITIYARQGARRVDLSRYPATITGLSRKVRFVAILENATSSTAYNAQVRLFDYTNSVEIASSPLDNTAAADRSVATEVVSSVLTVGSSAGNIRSDVAAMYHVHFRGQGTIPPTERVLLATAFLRITYE